MKLRELGARSMGAAMGALALGVFGWGCVTRVGAEGTPAAVLLVLSKGERKLAIVDPATLKIRAKAPTGIDPHEVVASADGKLAYVSNYGDKQPGNSLSVIDLQSAKEIRQVDLGPLQRPHGLVEAGGKIYFTCEANRAVARYDPSADRVDWMMGTGQAITHMLVVTPDGSRLYTANMLSDTVTAIDVEAQPGPGGVTQIPVGKGPEGIAVSPDGKEVWVAHRGGSIAVIDTSADKVVTSFPAGPMVRLAFSKDGKRVYGADIKTGELIRFDAAGRKETGRLKLGDGPGCMLEAPDGKRLFVGSLGGQRVDVVDVEKLTRTASIDGIGPIPDGIAWAEARKTPAAAARPKGSLGVGLSPVPDDLRAAEKLQPEQGILVQQVLPGSAAEAAGLKTGDILLSVNGKPLQDPEHLVALVARSYAEDVLTLEVQRDGQKRSVKATLKPRPQG